MAVLTRCPNSTICMGKTFKTLEYTWGGSRIKHKILLEYMPRGRKPSKGEKLENRGFKMLKLDEFGLGP